MRARHKKLLTAFDRNSKHLFRKSKLGRRLKMSEFTARMIKEARIKAGYTQDEAAELMKTNKRVISQTEANKRTISADDTCFAGVFGHKVKYLPKQTANWAIMIFLGRKEY